MAWDYLSTPEGYATPEQLKSSRDYAKALMTGEGQQKVHHWTQGVSNMVSALVGGNLDYGAAQREKQLLDIHARDLASPYPMQDYSQAPVGTSAPPSDRGDLTPSQRSTGRDATSAIPGGDLMSRVINFEGFAPKAKWDYQQYTNGYGTRAMAPNETIDEPEGRRRLQSELGKAQASLANVLPPNTPPNVRDALTSFTYNLGSGWTNGSLLATAVQRGDWKTAASEMQKYNHAGGQVLPALVDRRAKEGQWLLTPYTQQANGTQPANPVQQASLQGGATQAAKEQTGASQAPTAAGSVAPPQQEAQAGPEEGVQQAAAKKMAPQGGAPMPQGRGRMYIDPRMIPQRPGFTPEQFRALMANPLTTPEERVWAQGIMQQHGQPIIMQDPSGSGGSIVINPFDPTQQMFMAPPWYRGTKKFGDTELPYIQGVGPDQKPRDIEPEEAPGPQSQASPTAAPAGGGGGTPAPTPITAQNAPAQPSAPANATQKGTQVASLGGVVPKAMQQGETPKAEVGKPTVQPVSETGPDISKPLGRFAASPIPGMSARDYATMTGLNKYKQEQAEEKEARKHSAELASKKYDDVAKNAKKADEALVPVYNMQALARNPNTDFSTQSWGGWFETEAKKKLAGHFGYDPTQNNLYDKNTADLVLKEIGPTLQGTGQVRVAEIMLLGASTPNRQLTREANQYLLNGKQKALAYAVNMGKMASAYTQNQDVIDPDSGKVLLKAGEGNRNGLNAGFDQIMRGYSEDHPLFTAKEKAYLQNELGVDDNGDKVKKTQGSSTQENHAVGERKQFKQGWGVWDGSKWNPE